MTIYMKELLYYILCWNVIG